MPCIFPYFGTSNNSSTGQSGSDERSQGSDKLLESNGNPNDSVITNSTDSDLESEDGHVWSLRKKLSKADATIENLESLVKTIMHKQNELLGQVHELRQENTELIDECQMQRDYQTMERNSMLRELQEVRMRLRDRSRLLEKSVAQNRDLMFALQESNEKIYLMGVKMLKMQARQRQQSASSTSSSARTSSSSSSSASSRRRHRTKSPSSEERESSTSSSDTD